MSAWHHRRLRSTAAVLVASLFALTPASHALASTPESGASGARHWPVFSPGATVKTSLVAIDDVARVLYAFSQGGSGGTVQVQAWNLDLGTKLSAPASLPGTFDLSTKIPVAVDTTQHTVFVVEPASATSAPTIVVVKYAHGALSVVGTVTSRFAAGYSIVGLDSDRRHGLLYTLAEPSGCAAGVAGVCATTILGAGVGSVRFDALRLGALAQGHVDSPYAAPLSVPQACGQIIVTWFAAGVVVSARGDKAYFGCVSNRGVATPNGPHEGDVSGVGEFDLTSTASTLVIHPAPGNFGEGDSFAVPGQGRLLLVAPAAGATSLKVYDAVHGYYVGSVGVDDNEVFGVGVDPANGEGYYVDPNGLTAVDLAATPVPQGSVDPSYVAVMGNAVYRSIAVDPRTHRVFVVSSDDQSQGSSPFVDVRQGAADSGSGGFSDNGQFDGIDAPEIAGVTDSARVATVGAAGAEERLVGGTADLKQNITENVDTHGLGTRPGTRDIQFGVLSGIQLTNDQATAQAVTEIQDNATTDDATAQTPAAPDQVPSDIQKQYKQYQLTGGAASAAPAQCVDFGSSPSKASAESEAVSCDHTGQHVTASATAKPGRVLINSPCAPSPGKPCSPTDAGSTVPDPVSIKSASATTEIVRNGAGPMVTTITSEADGIDIMGIVRLGRVTATATITAHGRSGTAKVTYTRTVTGLVVNGTTVCASDCPLATVMAAVNTALGGRGHVDVPTPTVVQAANGRLALVQDSPYHHVEQVLFDDLSDDNVLTPAMSITMYFDESTSSREHVNLAAIGGQEIYRIFRLTSFVSGGGPQTPANLVSVGGRLSGAGSLPAITPFVGPPQTTQPPQVASDGGGIGAILNRAMHLGLRSPGDILGVAILWMLLAVPAYLAARRRLLLDLPRLTPKGNS